MQCLADWDRNTWITPSDVAAFTVEWFYSANNPDPFCTTADLNRDGAATPADVALFIQYWYRGVQAGGVCP